MSQNASAPGLLSRLPQPPRKVVLLRASRIGDFLCAAPALRMLRNALPAAEISMITLPMLKDLVERSPYLDRYIPFPGYPGLAEQFFDARRAVLFFKQMQDEQFDLAIQMQGSGVNSNPFMLMLGAQATAGFIRPGDTPGLLDAALPFPEKEHEIRRVLALTTFLLSPPETGLKKEEFGSTYQLATDTSSVYESKPNTSSDLSPEAPAQGEELVFPLRLQDLSEAEMILKDVPCPLIALHPSARDLTRRWPPERFAAAGNLLQQRYGGTVLIIGDAEAQEPGVAVEQNLRAPCLNLIGQTSLVVLGGIIKLLSVLLTNDTGPAHIAYALRTPTVTIFGGGSPQLNGPLQPGPFRVLAHEVPCRPCNYRTCPIGYTCLEHITVQQVVEAAEAVMR
jgi:ADP-heptose:LPS heptosyltransferase